MARIRTIKPGFFRHRQLYLAEKETSLPLRIAFAGLWTVADREGRFKWEPEELRLDCLPYDDVDFSAVMDALADNGFIARYEHSGDQYGHIPKWLKHQHVNQRETESDIPAPDEDGARTCNNIPARGEGKGREQEGKGTESRASEILAPNEFDLLESQLREAAGQEENPNIGMKDLSPMIGLIDAGYDLHRDILPKLRASKASGKAPNSWRYYVKGIEESKQANAAIKPLAKVVAPVEWIPCVDSRWTALAERYRAEHGRSPPTTSGANGMGRHFPAEWIAQPEPMEATTQ
jgi:hypothetical protein